MNIKSSGVGLTLLLAASFFISSCGGGGGTSHIGPTIISVTPVNGAIQVPTNSLITATFNTPMSPDSLNGATFSATAPSLGPSVGKTPSVIHKATIDHPTTVSLPGTVTFSGRTATLTLDALMPQNMVITVTISTGVHNLANQFLAVPYVWTFTTGTNDFPPAVVSTIPVAGAVGVSTGTDVSAIFSKAIDPSSVTTTTFNLAGPNNVTIPATVTYANNVAILHPASSLTTNTHYSATVTTGVKDVAGTFLVSNFTWTFTTGAGDVAPTVASTIPVTSASGVPLSSKVSATFSKAMNPATITTATFSLTGPGNVGVPATVAYSNNTATLTPNSLLGPETTYTATVSTGVKDIAGTPMANTFTWSFMTGVADVPPAVISTFPVNNQSQVGVGDSVTANFNEALNPATVNGSTFTLTGPGNVSVPATISYSNNVATLTPTSNLAGNAQFTATVTTGVKDVAGTPMVANFTWTFSTGQSPINFGTAGTYGVLAGSTVTNLGPTVIKGDLGVSPGTAITGFPPGTFTGVEHAGDAPAAQAKTDLLAAYTDAATRLNGVALPGDISGLTITPGLYSNAISVMLGVGSNVTFDAQGDPNAVFILQMGSTLTTGVGSTMTLIGGAQAKFIYWSVGSSATFGVNSTIVGNVLASASITANTGASLNGRFLTNVAAVSLASNSITVPPRHFGKAPPPPAHPKGKRS